MDKIIIVDFDQTYKVNCKKVREFNVFSEIISLKGLSKN